MRLQGLETSFSIKNLRHEKNVDSVLHSIVKIKLKNK